MRLAARVLLPGTGCVAFEELMDLVCLMIDLTGKSFLPRGSLAFFDFHTMRAVCEATISFRFRRPAFSRMDFEDTLSLRAVFVIVRATDLIDWSGSKQNFVSFQVTQPISIAEYICSTTYILTKC